MVSSNEVHTLEPGPGLTILPVGPGPNRWFASWYRLFPGGSIVKESTWLKSSTGKREVACCYIMSSLKRLRHAQAKREWLNTVSSLGFRAQYRDTSLQDISGLHNLRIFIGELRESERILRGKLKNIVITDPSYHTPLKIKHNKHLYR